MAAKPDLVEGVESRMQALEGVVPDPARPPQGCRFHTRCRVVTPACGWEVDDVVRFLEAREAMFDNLSSVARSSPFAADLVFSDEASAQRLAAALRSDAVPAAMQAAMEELTVDRGTVRVRFGEVDEVRLTARGPDHVAACILDPDMIEASETRKAS
jgi:peptide/nickel transport system ATP-binding protein